jgi:hypothetical protein
MMASFMLEPSRPSMTPGEKWARSSSTWARTSSGEYRVLSMGTPAANTAVSMVWAAGEAEAVTAGCSTGNGGSGAAGGAGVWPAGAA